MIYNTKNTQIYWETYGEGLPLVMLHGNSQTHRIFDKSVYLLKSYYKVYVIDLPGHGKSRTESELTYESMAEDIYQFITGARIENAMIYGFSDGGIIALLLAINHPQSFSSLIVSGVNTSIDGIKKTWLYLIKTAYTFTRSKKFKLILSPPKITKAMLKSISIPVIMTVGVRDMIDPLHTRAVSHMIPGCELAIFPGETHSSYITHSHKLGSYIIAKKKP